MSEFEIATFAYQEATLASRYAGLWIAAAQVGVGLLQAAVWYGIRAMQRAGTQRAREQDQRHVEDMVRLDQQGRALGTLIERTAPRATG